MHVAVPAIAMNVNWNMELLVEFGQIPFKSGILRPKRLQLAHHYPNAFASLVTCGHIVGHLVCILLEAHPEAMNLLKNIQHFLLGRSPAFERPGEQLFTFSLVEATQTIANIFPTFGSSVRSMSEIRNPILP
jgi:hypothetical protein